MSSIEDMLDEEIEGADEVDLDDFLTEEFSDNEEDENPFETGEETGEDKEVDIEEMLVNPDVDIDDLDEVQAEMYNIITNADRTSWEKGEGFTCKFPKLVEKLNGIQPGLGFIGAQSNVGKSGFLLEVGYSASQLDDVYSLYFSLDDGAVDLLPRIIAANKRIPINAVRMPTTFKEYPQILERREEGYQELYSSYDRFKMLDQGSVSNTLGTIVEQIEKHYEYLEENDIDKKLFVQIDNFHDIRVEGKNFYGDDNQKYEHIADKLNTLCETLQIPIWCTAELRKSANNQRPSFHDIKAATKINYIAKLCLMCYNEVGVEKDNAEIYYINEDRPGKSPIFEVHFDKNKLSPFKGRIYYEFVPEYGLYEECTDADIEKYNNKIYQD
jgi:replicative DNA helicase